MSTEHPRKAEILNRIRTDKASGRSVSERDEMILFLEDGSKSSNEELITHIRNDPDGSLILTGANWISDYHSPRSMKIYLNPYDRIFWVNILIACEGRGDKHTSKLSNAVNDLDAFLEFYRPPLFGDPWLVYKEKMRSAGFFSFTKRLMNPRYEELEAAFSEAREWVKLNSTDPEFNSVQINFCFAGHGDFEPVNGATIQVLDDEIPADEIAELIHEIIPTVKDCENRHRLDIYLDCCHAGAVALDIYKNVLKINKKKLSSGEAITFDDGAVLGGVGPGRFFCSSMHDEPSFENDIVGHGYFTYAFLNEYSSKPVCIGQGPNIALRDIGWYSQGLQHPFFISFLKSSHPEYEDFLIKFPSMKHLQNSLLNPKIKLTITKTLLLKLARMYHKIRSKFAKKIVDLSYGDQFISNVFDELEFRRQIVSGVENSLILAPELRQEYDKKEYYEAEIHWF